MYPTGMFQGGPLQPPVLYVLNSSLRAVRDARETLYRSWRWTQFPPKSQVASAGPGQTWVGWMGRQALR
jgi:hypothetical protein